MLGLIRRTFGSRNPVGIATAFKVQVRPFLEYACPVWNPYLVKDIYLMESVQRTEESFESHLKRWKGVHREIKGVKKGFLITEAYISKPG